MKKLKLIFFLVAVLVAELVKADLLTDASDAYDKGEYIKAAVLFESLAEKGNVKAQAMLGIMYREGHGVQKNIPEAIRWLSLAAEQGVISAWSELGVIFINNHSFQNYERAKELFLLAAEHVEPKAMFALGILYYKGLGVPIDFIRAYMWFNFLMEYSSMPDRPGLLVQDAFNEARRMLNTLSKVMSHDQINEAQALSMRCVDNRFKNC
ncbi:tetratricopeptide repeat protein [Nitrosomonas communis]|uniref:tetratricopeptide repeat protein n=1 Tax=Nitrosomonas communis TaxID=44574 RepID=UPI0026F2C16B|nr:tetratricopeptide repeat protein [Nitrosomonas communis]MCO6427614.1 sel1 repeat family protein [Nitrosomonas communis]